MGEGRACPVLDTGERGHLPVKISEGPFITMAHFAEIVFIALMLSSTYILVAVGFTLFFGAIDIVQFTQHGYVPVGELDDIDGAEKECEPHGDEDVGAAEH